MEEKRQHSIHIMARHPFPSSILSLHLISPFELTSISLTPPSSNNQRVAITWTSHGLLLHKITLKKERKKRKRVPSFNPTPPTHFIGEESKIQYIIHLLCHQKSKSHHDLLYLIQLPTKHQTNNEAFLSSSRPSPNILRTRKTRISLH